MRIDGKRKEKSRARTVKQFQQAAVATCLLFPVSLNGRTTQLNYPYRQRPSFALLKDQCYKANGIYIYVQALDNQQQRKTSSNIIQSRTLYYQVLLTPIWASTLILALDILPHRSRNENILSQITIAVAAPQIGISIRSLISLNSRHGLPAALDIVKSDRSCAVLGSETRVIEGAFAGASS